MEKAMEIRDADGTLCGSYHYEDPFKSFFRGLYTPGGRDVVAAPPPEHPHHKGLQFGLCASDVNFWEEDEAQEPAGLKLPIGRQQTLAIEPLAPGGGNGFRQEVLWTSKGVNTFHETRKVSLEKAAPGYVWTWQTTLIAARRVEVIKSAWAEGPGQFGYTGLGLRLAQDLFQNGVVFPPTATSGDTPVWVSFRGGGAEVRFEQDAKQGHALFLSRYGADGPGFAFISLGPTNSHPLILMPGQRLEATYKVTVADC